MNQILQQVLSLISPGLLLLAIMLFVVGVMLSPLAVKKQVTILLWYPNWVWSRLKRFMATEPSFWRLCLVIFMLNATSLLFNLCIGFGVVVPFIAAVVLGLNVGIIAYQEGGFKTLGAMFLAPHTLFELPAAWLSLALSIRIGLTLIQQPTALGFVVKTSLAIYLKLILGLLFLAAVIEAGLIVLFRGQSQHATPLADEPFGSQQDNHQYQ
ncbi:MAG: stage II sporulation protein M [candidate division KSB1 bacterium]|nr:stage II sporulation protein M [candidate division KSB1 bacterium]